MRATRILATLVVASCFSASFASILYSHTSETGSRYNPGLATGDTTPRFALDDVHIPVDRLGGFTSINVTKITVGIRRAAAAPATNVSLGWSEAVLDATYPGVPAAPPAVVGTKSLAARSGTGFFTEIVEFGDGVSTLMSVDLNMDARAGYGLFYAGLQLSNTSGDNGWRITNGADFNFNSGDFGQFHGYRPDTGGWERFRFSEDGTTPGSFYMIVEGEPVPEPATLLALGAGIAAIAARRRRK